MLPVYKAQLYLLGERAKELALQGTATQMKTGQRW